MSTHSCPRCLSPRPEFRPLCKTCALIEEGLIRQAAQEQAAATLAFFSNTAELTYDEAGEFDALTAGKHYGSWELEDTAGLLPQPDKKSILRRKKPEEPKPVVGGGLGLADPDEARRAIAEARSGVPAFDPNKIMEANNAWMEMEEKALAEHKARSILPVAPDKWLYAAFFTAGTALGVGILIIILSITGVLS